MAADEIDYQVIGDDLQAVIITLDPGEAVFAEAGAMMFMREGITMAPTLDPNSKSGGLFDKLVGSFVLSVFRTVFVVQELPGMTCGVLARRVEFHP